MSTAELVYTPEDLLNLSDCDGYELVSGKLVERKTGYESAWVAGELFCLLRNYCGQRNLGDVAPAEAGFRCYSDDPNRVRKPDLSFIRAGRFPGGRLPRGYVMLVPDLVVEVVSPRDVFEELSEKVAEYLTAGVRLVWVIDSIARKVFVYHPDGRGVILSDRDSLDGEEVIPGFSVQIADLFRRLDAASPDEA